MCAYNRAYQRRAMPRPSNRDQRREEIVRGLLVVMAARGYAGASIKTIAQEVKLAPGLVHYHFSCKQEILVELIETIMKRVEDRRVRLEGKASSPLAKLRALIDAYLALGKDASPSDVAAWVVIGSEAVRQPAVGKVYEHWIRARKRQIESLLREELRSRGKAVRDVSRIATALIAQMEGAYQLAAATKGVVPRGYSARTAKEMVESWIEASPRT